MAARIVCFGELLLRLGAPGRELLLQSPRLQVHVGGAEANVAVSLARFGHQVTLVSVLPDNPLGAVAAGELRRHGVNTDEVQPGPGRMGLYFLQTGTGLRPSEVLYDRAGSAFALADPAGYDWPRLLAGADWLHLSGVTPALGEGSAAAAIAAVRCARQLGVRVSFDGNFRPKLWQAWQGDAPGILRQILAETDLLFADHRDMAVVLETRFPEASPDALVEAAAVAAFAAFPNLGRLASTIRIQHSVDQHSLSALMLARDGRREQAPARELAQIVDRIGAGDAFAAGLLHSLVSGMDDGDSLRFGLAAACLKHSIPGDFNLLDLADVSACVDQAGYDVRR
jgi:2-dehydro-3-deoxygluconokinase